MSADWFISPIVEGQGDVEAVPILLRRIAADLLQTNPRINRPIRIKTGAFLKYDEYFRNHFELAARKALVAKNACVLILLDCEDNCPAILGPAILEQAKSIRTDVHTIVALAYREYETWFLTAAESLSSIGGLPSGLISPLDPERKRDAKGWFSEKMNARYDEIIHQPRWTSRFSLEQARGNPSFDRLWEKMAAFFSM